MDEDAPTIPIAAVPTIVHFGTGTQELNGRPYRLVAIAFSTPQGLQTFMLEPEQAHVVAQQLTELAAMLHLENVGPEELERQLAAAEPDR